MTTQTPDAVREAAIELLAKAAERAGCVEVPKGLRGGDVALISSEIAISAILAALDSRAGDAGEESEALTAAQLDSVLDALTFALAGETDKDAFPRGMAVMERAYSKLSGLKGRTLRAFAAPAPAVDAVPAGEVERLARIRTSMALLQQNSEGCALNHYGNDATLHGMPGWLIDTKADLNALTDLLAKWEANHG